MGHADSLLGDLSLGALGGRGRHRGGQSSVHQGKPSKTLRRKESGKQRALTVIPTTPIGVLSANLGLAWCKAPDLQNL